MRPPILALFLFAITSAAFATVTIDNDGVTATVTPGGGAVFYFAGDGPQRCGFCATPVSGGVVVLDTTHSGSVRFFRPNNESDVFTVWFVADLITGNVEIAQWGPAVRRSISPPFAARGADNVLSRISLMMGRPYTHLCLLRPTVGAWTHESFRLPALGDVDASRFTYAISSLQPLPGVPAAPPSVQSGDWAIGVDVVNRQFFAEKVDLSANDGGIFLLFETGADIEGQPVQIMVTRELGSNGTAMLAYSTGSDRSAAPVSGTLTFAPGETIKYFEIPTTADDTFSIHAVPITLQATGASLDRGPFVAGFADNHPLPTVSVKSTNVTMGAPAALTFTLNGNTTVFADVEYVIDGVVSGDYVSFAPGETTKTVQVLDYHAPFSTVQLASTDNCTIAQGTATITVDPNSPLHASSADVVTTEGDTTHDAVVTLTLSQPARSVDVGYGFRNGTAFNDVDFTGRAGIVHFASGETTKTFSIPILGNTSPQPDRQFYVDFLSFDTAIATPSITVTIKDDDGPLMLSVADASSDTQQVVVPLTLSAPSLVGPVTVHVSTTNGTAIAGVDYVPIALDEEIRAGSTSTQAGITLILHPGEPSKFFNVNLSGATGAVIARGTATVTIINPAAPPAHHRAAAH